MYSTCTLNGCSEPVYDLWNEKIEKKDELLMIILNKETLFLNNFFWWGGGEVVNFCMNVRIP